MHTLFDPKRLQPGDVLLYRSDGPISWAIRTFDQCEASHAGLYYGNDRVVEALIQPTVRDRAMSFAGCNWIDARRLNDSHPLGAAGNANTKLDMRPVSCVAEKYLAQQDRYAFGQILLLGVICLTRELDFSNPMVRGIAHRSMAAADAMLQALKSNGKQPLICSEFVFRCYDEAVLRCLPRAPGTGNLLPGAGSGDALPTPDERYQLAIPSQATRQPRAWFSWFCQRSAGAPGAMPPNVHPASLLPRVQHRLDEVQVSPAAAAASSPAGAWRDELINLINNFAAEREDFAAEPQQRSVAAPSSAAIPEVGMDAVDAMAARFARNLADSHHETDVRGQPTARTLAAAAARVQAVVADMVTPGDLEKSCSLTTLGRILP